MSYTMTIEAPEKAAWFEQRRLKISQEQLGALFADRQRDAILSVAGGWQDTRTQEEIIADIEEHRTTGREVTI